MPFPQEETRYLLHHGTPVTLDPRLIVRIDGFEEEGLLPGGLGDAGGLLLRLLLLGALLPRPQLVPDTVDKRVRNEPVLIVLLNRAKSLWLLKILNKEYMYSLRF